MWQWSHMSDLRSHCQPSANDVASDLYHDFMDVVQVHSFKIFKSQSWLFTEETSEEVNSLELNIICFGVRIVTTYLFFLILSFSIKNKQMSTQTFPFCHHHFGARTFYSCWMQTSVCYQTLSFFLIWNTWYGIHENHSFGSILLLAITVT